MTETAYFHRVFVILQPKYKPNTTMKISKTFILGLALLAMTSCNKDMFDKDLYNNNVNFLFMVDNADPEQDWCLTKSDTVTIKTPESSIYSIKILTENPYTSSNAEIAAEAVTYTWDGLQATVAYTIPISQTTAYIAALDENGSYLGVVPFTFGTEEVEIRLADLQRSASLNTPFYQTFTYLYESTFPQPDDFDYNDMVLRISKSIPNIANSNTIDLTVTLAACGAGELYAAAIQLDGIKYSDIEKIEIIGDKPMDNGYPISPTFITNDNVLQQGRNGNAVIRLFDCAQWAISKQQDNVGDIAVIRYNTTHDTKEEYSATVSPVTTTYQITFKDREVARCFTFDRIDPFLIHEYNTGFFEVHTYAHKFDLCISPIETDLRAYDNHISWSLVIPKGDFRYPIEGISLCSYNSETGEVFGPYRGFSGWMQDHYTNLDWYKSVTQATLVY
jgi:LruC domain-containing protein